MVSPQPTSRHKTYHLLEFYKLLYILSPVYPDTEIKTMATKKKAASKKKTTKKKAAKKKR